MYTTARLEDVIRNSVLSHDLRADCQRTIEDLTLLTAVLYEYFQVYTERGMELEDSLVSHENASIPVTILRSGARGRPFMFISKDQIEALLDFGYTYTRIATMFGISERTLLRRRIEWGLPSGRYLSEISDDDLDDSIRRIIHVSLAKVF